MRHPPLLTFSAVLLSLVAFAAPTPLHAEEVQEGDTVTWIKELPKALAQAKDKDRLLMICINAKFVMGRPGREEPAAKGLREVVYKDVRVVRASREFVCAFLDTSGGSDDFGELRALGIEGNIVSPQHIFVEPKTDKIVGRLEYWSYGKGESAVTQLLKMMKDASATREAPATDPSASTPEGAEPEAGTPEEAAPEEAMPDAPELDAEHAAARATWIQKMLKQCVENTTARRTSAARSLIKNDKEGDCIDPLLALVPEHEDNVDVVTDLIRELGVPGLAKAAPVVATMLKHKEPMVRGNAAVSLEYIGSDDKKVRSELRKRVAKEKEDAPRNHMYRALGRCANGDSKVRSMLIKAAEKNLLKDSDASIGPLIGLAYFEGDKKAARAVEGMLQKVGRPGGRRGGGGNTLARAMCGWTLAEIGDPKSAKMVREKLIDPLEHWQSRWKGAIIRFYEAIAAKCEGDDSAMDDVQAGVARLFRDADMSSFHDDARKGRQGGAWTPKGDWIGSTDA